MTVDTVVAHVQLAAHKPLGPRQIPLQNLVPRLEPVQIGRHACPELFGILDGLFVERLVLLQALDVSLGAELLRRRKHAVFAQCGVDVLVGDGCRQARHAMSSKELNRLGFRGALRRGAQAGEAPTQTLSGGRLDGQVPSFPGQSQDDKNLIVICITFSLFVPIGN